MADFVKRAARQAAAAVAMGSRLWPVVPRGTALVLRYHRVAPPGAGPVPLALPAEEFDGQLQFLRAQCAVVTAGEIAAAAAEGRPMPPRAVAITFDDGYEDNCSQALPILRRHGLRATFFVAAGWVGTERVLWWDRVHDYIRQATAVGARPIDYEDVPGPVVAVLAAADLRSAASAARFERTLVAALRALRLPPEKLEALVERVAASLGADVVEPEPYRPMDWDQVRELREAGMEIGSHGVSHACLGDVPAERAYDELEQSKQALEQQLGEPVSLVAYPAGSYSRDVVDLVQEAGYAAAFTTAVGPVRPGDDAFALRRVGVWSGGYRGAFGRFSGAVFGLQLGRLARRVEQDA